MGLQNSRSIISVTPETTGAASLEPADTERELRAFSIDAPLHDWRLDRALAQRVPEFSRTYLQHLITTGAVTLNGQVVSRVSMKVHAGDQGVVELRPTPQCQAFKAETPQLDVVYQDHDLWVINKAAGMVVHPAPGNWSGTLLNHLLGLDAHAFELPRAGIVHRLDKDTSGLMVVARNRITMDALVRAIAQRQVKRQYLALAHKPWLGATTRQVTGPIGRDPFNRLRMAVVDLAQHPGKTALTDIECLDSNAQGCLVKCSLHTGRTHQIRVHLASIGHPLVADVTYGGACTAGLTRQGLHATRLAFDHPISGASLVFESTPPTDLLQAIGQMGLAYNSASF